MGNQAAPLSTNCRVRQRERRTAKTNILPWGRQQHLTHTYEYSRYPRWKGKRATPVFKEIPLLLSLSRPSPPIASRPTVGWDIGGRCVLTSDAIDGGIILFPLQKRWCLNQQKGKYIPTVLQCFSQYKVVFFYGPSILFLLPTVGDPSTETYGTAGAKAKEGGGGTHFSTGLTPSPFPPYCSFLIPSPPGFVCTRIQSVASAAKATTHYRKEREMYFFGRIMTLRDRIIFVGTPRPRETYLRPRVGSFAPSGPRNQKEWSILVYFL